MNHLLTSLAIAAIAAWSCIPAHAESQPSNAGTHSDSALTFPQASTTQESESFETQTSKNNLAQNSDIWKYKRKFMLGYTTGTLDQKKRFGGEISSRWGASITYGIAHIYLHRGPIGGFLKFGLNIDMNLNYMNFAKGSGKISDIMHPNDDGEIGAISLGRHYFTSGLAIGPSASFAPFYASSNKRLASLIFRPYFHVVPSYAAYIISEDDDTEVHGAFALWCAAGLELQWKHLIVGFEWKGSTAKYKGFLDSLISEIADGYEAEGSHKFDVNMFNFSIGFAF